MMIVIAMAAIAIFAALLVSRLNVTEDISRILLTLPSLSHLSNAINPKPCRNFSRRRRAAVGLLFDLAPSGVYLAEAVT